jgi:hypothetical protein
MATTLYLWNLSGFAAAGKCTTSAEAEVDRLGSAAGIRFNQSLDCCLLASSCGSGIDLYHSHFHTGCIEPSSLGTIFLPKFFFLALGFSQSFL